MLSLQGERAAAGLQLATNVAAVPHLQCRSRCQRLPACTSQGLTSLKAKSTHAPRPPLVVAAAGKGFGTAKAPSVAETCTCGSKKVYRECCQPFHEGTATPSDVETALRARFSGFIKSKVDYVVDTFHPDYHTFKYESSEPGGAGAQLKRDVTAACYRFNYSKLKVNEVKEGASPDEAFITFQYNTFQKNAGEARTGFRRVKTKEMPVERNPDGTPIISTTVEKSRFLRVNGKWLFASYELLEYPPYMEEAKQAELRAKQPAAA